MMRFARYLLRWLLYASVGALKAWIAVAPFLVACGLIAFWPKETAFRWFGGILQLIGFAITVSEIIGIQKLFDGEGPLKSIAAYWRNRPLLKNGHTLIAGSASFSVSTNTNVSVIARKIPGNTEERLKKIEADVLLVRNEAEVAKQQNQFAQKQIDDSRLAGDQELQSDLSALRSKMTEATVGSLGYRALGVWYFALGITLATLSLDLACWLGGKCP